jgi:hypothetical protein
VLNTRLASQRVDQQSFIGGKPKLPPSASIPSCELCGSTLTFMFQIAFPDGENWSGRTLALFLCAACADENYLIPEMLSSGLRDADIPKGFLTDYQRNFAFLVFPSDEGTILTSYVEAVAYSEIEMHKGDALGTFGKLGGPPNWVLEDESPATYAGTSRLLFLLQLAPDLHFETVSSARPQIELDLTGQPVTSPLGYYQLFLGNALYLFGTDGCEPLVYAITQS